MCVTKVKLGTAAVLSMALLGALIGGSVLPLVSAQPDRGKEKLSFTVKVESDEAFIRRMSKDLREAEPTQTEVHFFSSSKDAQKRQKLIDLFIEERKAKKGASDAAKVAKQLADDIQWSPAKLDEGWLNLIIRRAPTAELATIQKGFFKDVLAATGKAELAKVTQAYLEGLQTYLKSNPGSPEAPEVIRQIVLICEAQGKKVEADAWRAKLKGESKHPRSEKEKPASSGGN
jgi:hypothetical protein